MQAAKVKVPGLENNNFTEILDFSFLCEVLWFPVELEFDTNQQVALKSLGLECLVEAGMEGQLL